MKYIAIIFLLVGGLSVNDAVSQDYLFRVLANKGTNQIKKAGPQAATSLKTGSKLYSGDQIIASQGAYIGLVYKTGKTIEIRTAGTYNLKDLEAKVNRGSVSVTGRYMNFVMNKMNESDEDVNRNYRRNLNATGAVERATGYDLSLMMMNTTAPNKVYGDQTIIRWEGGEENDSYIVTVKDIFGDLVAEVETNENKIELDFTSEELSTYRLLVVDVKSANNEKVISQEYGIQKLTAQEANIQSTLDELTAQLDEGSTLNNIIYASFYEDNSLLLDALTKYEAAVEENPEIDDFKTIYEQFVMANSLAMAGE